MDERQRRLAENEIVFRQVNERIDAVSASFTTPSKTLGIVCECGYATCAEQIEVAPGEYERVRATPTWFFVLPGHEIPDIERIVEPGDAYHVIEKLPGGPGELAEATDPR